MDGSAIPNRIWFPISIAASFHCHPAKPQSAFSSQEHHVYHFRQGDRGHQFVLVYNDNSIAGLLYTKYRVFVTYSNYVQRKLES